MHTLTDAYLKASESSITSVTLTLQPYEGPEMFSAVRHYCNPNEIPRSRGVAGSYCRTAISTKRDVQSASSLSAPCYTLTLTNLKIRPTSMSGMSRLRDAVVAIVAGFRRCTEQGEYWRPLYRPTVVITARVVQLHKHNAVNVQSLAQSVHITVWTLSHGVECRLNQALEMR